MTASAADQRTPAAGDPLLAVACPECQVALAAERSRAGHPACCPLCRAGFVVPVPPRPRAAESGFTDGEQHRQAREDRSRRRTRRNIVMLLSGVGILMLIVLTLGTRRPKKRR